MIIFNYPKNIKKSSFLLSRTKNVDNSMKHQLWYPSEEWWFHCLEHSYVALSIIVIALVGKRSCSGNTAWWFSQEEMQECVYLIIALKGISLVVIVIDAHVENNLTWHNRACCESSVRNAINRWWCLRNRTITHRGS